METAPYQKNSDTSKAAAESIEPHLSYLENTILQLIKESGSTGMNCWEIEIKLRISRPCSSARLNGLKEKGHIIDSNIRRITDSGRSAAVYVCNKQSEYQGEFNFV